MYLVKRRGACRHTESDELLLDKVRLCTGALLMHNAVLYAACCLYSLSYTEEMFRLLSYDFRMVQLCMQLPFDAYLILIMSYICMSYI